MKTQRFFARVVLLAILLLAAPAKATVPSITMDDLYGVAGLYEDRLDRAASNSDEAEISTDASEAASAKQAAGETSLSDMPIPLVGPFSLEIIESTPETQNELSKILTFMREKELPVVDYFDFRAGNQNGELKKQIALLLPSGFNLNTLVMHEFVTAEPLFYSENTGNVMAAFDFPTEYRENQIVVAVAGVFDANEWVDWFPLKAEPAMESDEAIRVRIHFTQDALKKAEGKPFGLAILGQ